MGWTSPEAREFVHLFATQQVERRQDDLARVVSALKTLPASLETLEKLCALPTQDTQRALREHPGYKQQRKLNSIETMLQVFHRSLADLATAVDAFPPPGPPDLRGERKSLEAEISIRVNKELLAAISASQALVDYSRGVRGWIPASFEAKRAEIFDNDEHALVKSLRNLINHERHTTANWQTTYTHAGRMTCFKIEAEVLLAETKLGADARRSLAAHGPILNVTELLTGYAKRVDEFYGWLLPELENNLPVEVVEFRRCEAAVKLQQAREGYKLLVNLWLQANADPYEHLHKHLTEAQAARVSELPQRSKEQVDYIITCLDRDLVCDEELRLLLYRFFRVPI